MLIGVQTEEDAMEKRRGVVFSLEIAVEFEEFGKERKDESKRYLRLLSKVLHIVRQLGAHQIEQQGDEDNP